MYERPRVKRESWARFASYFYAWPSMHCLFYLRAYNLRAFARKNYAPVEIHLKMRISVTQIDMEIVYICLCL